MTEVPIPVQPCAVDVHSQHSSHGRSITQGLRLAYLRQFYIENQDNATLMQDCTDELAVLLQWFERKHDNRGSRSQK